VKAEGESTKRILKQNRHPLGACRIEVKEELNAQERRKYQFIHDHQQEYPVQTMCHVLAVSESGY
jgi:hypothetical protein